MDAPRRSEAAVTGRSDGKGSAPGDAALPASRLSPRQAEIQLANRAYLASHGLAWPDDDRSDGASAGAVAEPMAGTAWRRLDVTLRSLRSA
jgi:hypothetical protein